MKTFDPAPGMETFPKQGPKPGKNVEKKFRIFIKRTETIKIILGSVSHGVVAVAAVIRNITEEEEKNV